MTSPFRARVNDVTRTSRIKRREIDKQRSETAIMSASHGALGNAPISYTSMAEHIAQQRHALRHEAIARLAYARAEQRGFVPGHALEDWLTAEVQIAAEERDGGSTTMSHI
jgi:hypothetical protein